MLTRMRAKLGLCEARPEDGELVDDLLRLMAKDRSDFTFTFRALGHFDSQFAGSDNAAVRDWFVDRPALEAWAER